MNVNLLNNHKVLNVSSSLLQVFITAVISIFISKFTFQYLGPSLLGFWAITLSISSFGSFLNSGICVAVIRFIALSNNENDLEAIRKVSLTSVIISILLTLLACILLTCIYLLYFFYQPPSIEIDWKQYALFAIAIFFIISLSNVVMNIFDGLKLTYNKNIVLIIGSVIYFFAAFYFIKKYQLKGVVISLILQNICTLIIALLILCRKGILKFHKSCFDNNTARELLKFSFKVQYITVLGAFFDPITKTLMNYFGSYSNVGIYEMSNKIVLQIRTILINLNQLLLPYFSQKEKNSAEKNIYLRIYGLLIIPTFILFVSIIIFAKPVSYFWLGSLNNEFIVYCVILTISALVNVISMPAYYSRLGNGVLKPLIKVHVVIGILNVIGGVTLGIYFKAMGVAIAWSFSLLLGSLIIMIKYAQDYHLSLWEHVNKKWILITGGMFLVFSPIFFKDLFSNNNYYSILILLFIVWIIVVMVQFYGETVKPILEKYNKKNNG